MRSVISTTPRAPAAPRPPRALSALREARMPEDDLVEDATIRGVLYDGTSFAGRDIELAEVETSRLDSVRFTGTQTRQVRFSDSAIQTADFAQLRAEDTSLVRATVTSSRLTGSSWSKSYFLDTRFETCRGDMSMWRHSTFKAVEFTGCNFVQADFQWAQFTDVVFHDCDLTGAQFAHVKMVRVRFENCTMFDIGGPTHLKGATVQGPGGIELAQALARDAGILLEP